MQSAKAQQRIFRFAAGGLRFWFALALAVLVALGSGSAPAALAAPGNDNFASAIDIGGTPAYVDAAFIVTTSATREGPENPGLSSCGSFPVSANTHSVWYRFTAAASGWVTVDTLLANYDTVLEVWAGPAPGVATIGTLTTPSLACNDDSGKASVRSEVTFPVTSGANYYIMVRDYGTTDAGGNLKLRASYSAVNQIYVDGATGDDSSNTGSAQLPFKTIQRGVNVVAAGGIVHVAAGAYAEAVTLNKNLTLIGAGSPTASSFTLTNGAVVSGSSGIVAPVVNVDQVGAPGAKIQDGVLLAAAGGVVNVAAGTYSENLVIGKSLTLQAGSGAAVQAAGGTAIKITAGTVTVNDFAIQGSTLGVSITGGSGHVFFHNNFSGNATGLTNTSGTAVAATSNYWGSSTGPAHATNAGGLGEAVSDNVTFTPWCTVAAPACTPLAAIPTQLIFITQPGNSLSSVPFPTQPKVRAQDASGNLGINFNRAVTMTIGTNPGGGSLNGTNPISGVTGVITFTNLSINAPGLGYTLIASASGLSAATSASFDIANNPPTAVNDTKTVREDSGAASIDVLANDLDDFPAPPAGIRIVSAVNGSNGAVITSSSILTYTPNANFFGTDVFTYRINDIYGSGVSTGTVTVTVTAVNDAPAFVKGLDQNVLEDAGAQTVPNWATSISPGPANESGQTVTFSLTNTNNSLFSAQPALNSAGTLTFTPAANKNGSATVFVTATDNGGTANGGQDTSATQTFVINVTAVNDAPSFTKGSNQTIAEDSGPQTVAGWATNIRPGPASATDEAGQALTFLITTTNDSLFAALPAINPATGDLTYNTALNASGLVTVGVRLQDNGGTANGGQDTSATQTFTINITPVNDPPVAVNDAATVLEDSGANAISVLPNDNSANPDVGETLTITAKTNGANGTVVITGGGTGLTYQPNANFNGADSFTYTISDSGGLTDTATVNVTVTPVNDMPSFTKGSNQTVLEDSGAQSVPSWATAMSPGPANESGQALTFLITTTNDSLFSVLPAVDATTGGLTFTPAPNAFGTVTVGVRLQDNGGTSNGGVDTSAMQTFTITITGVNDAPSFTKGSDQTVVEDAGAQTVTAWATSLSPGPGEAQTITFSLTNTNNSLFSTQPAINASGDLTFTPAANATGSATVFVTITDNGGTANGGVNTSGPQTFVINVTAVNDAPSFTKGANQSTPEDSGPQTVTGWATALSPGPADEAGQTLSFVVTNTNNSLFSVQPSVSPTGTLSYTSAPNAFGSANVGVRIQDNGGTASGGQDTSVTQTFTITIMPVNDPLTAVNDSAAILEDSGPTPVAVLPNDNAVNVDVGEVLTITAAGPAANGTVLFGNTVVTYTPAANFFGTDVFTYTATDGGFNATATVTLTVTGVNDAPSFAKGLDETVPEDSGPRTVAGWATSISPGAPNESAQALTFTALNTSNGLFSAQPAVSSAGTLTFTPAPNVSGSATVFIFLSDNGGTANGGQDTSAPQSFLITVTSANDPPTANNDSASALQNSGANPIDVLANDTFAPDIGETLVITAVTQGISGTVAITGGGTGLTYTPAAGFVGVDTFTYTISDGNGGAATATVTVTVGTPTSNLYLPLVLKNAAADLVGSFSLSPANPTAGQPVLVTVVITNQGSSTAGPFWVDFYVNPSTPPTGPNTPWNLVSSYGIAWYVPSVLGPGQSLTLTSAAGGFCASPTSGGSTPGAYCDANTIWSGAFASGAKDLYLFVDSWNPTVPTGAVPESNESNNRAELHFVSPLSGVTDFAVTDARRPEDLPERPQP